MKLNAEVYDRVAVLTLKGDFGEDDVPRLRKTVVEKMEARARDFVLDFTEAEAIDSHALEAMIWLQDHCAEKLGQVRLAACPEHVQQILTITRLAGRFDRHPDVDAALKSLR